MTQKQSQIQSFQDRPTIAGKAARSRSRQIIRRGENLLTLAGGKYTTYRLIAKQAVDEAYRILGQKPAKCRTASTPIPDYRPKPSGEKIADVPEVHASEIEHAVKHEMAATIEDIMRRRSGLAFSRFGGMDTVQNIARIAGQAGGWNESQLHKLAEEYRLQLVRTAIPIQSRR